MGSVVAHTGGEIVSQSPLQGRRPDIRRRRLQQRVDATDGEACSDNSSLRVKPAAGELVRTARNAISECWEGKSKWGFAAVSQNKNRRSCTPRASGNECGRNLSRRAAAKFFLHVGLGKPVVIDTKPAAYHPV